MEQTNLVVSPEGKTWDEVTRNTSYIGNCVHYAGSNASYATAVIIFDDRRGQLASVTRDLITKDFAIAYDRDICLRDGQYVIHATTINQVAGTAARHATIKVNGTDVHGSHTTGAAYSHNHTIVCRQLKRGDYVQIFGGWFAAHNVSAYWIERI